MNQIMNMFGYNTHAFTLCTSTPLYLHLFGIFLTM